MAEIKLKTPLDEKTVRQLKVGDSVTITGTIYTARDAAHKYFLESFPKPLPFDLKGAALYHCGPIVKKIGDRWTMVSAGPTTSARTSMYEPDIIEKYGVRAVVGKGGMDDKTLEAMKKFGAVYLNAVGGAGVLLAKAIKSVRNVYMLEEFGTPEAIWELDVNDFPAIVTMDSNGNSLHSDMLKKSTNEFRKIVDAKS